jgi:adenosylcobyric acid synthase
MFVGTGSDVGKSVLNAAFCRIFMQDGYHPAPFKAQNMSLNSYATPDGLEIGRAQAVQSEACGIPCQGEMNPILLKPTNDKSAQVVLNGKPAGNQTAMQYFNDTDRDWLFREAYKAFSCLDKVFNPIVIEGAGSIAEVNLWDKDITNMRVALETGASTFLIADIDKGGVIASVYGTLQLLPPEEKALIKGIIINKFRGDIALFKEGRKIIEELTGKPVVGVIPFFRDIFIEQEDAVVLDHYTSRFSEGKINIAVVLLKYMSNFTDFNMLERHPDTHLFYSRNSDEISKADIIIIPGSKNTISDLLHLRQSGLGKTIMELHQKGKQIYGICGGYQMMGKDIKDPDHVEGDIEEMAGLNILPISTTLLKEKKTIQTRFQYLDNPDVCSGYEIHMGQTSAEQERPLCMVGDKPDGFFLNPKTWGTYIHGIFDNKAVIKHVLQQVKKDANDEMDYRAYKELHYNKLADLVRANIDMEYVYCSLW